MRGWFGHFRIERQVGRGGLGAVYRAVDSRSGATVALKLLPHGSPDPLAGARLKREFSALRRLSHPNIVRVLDAGETEGIPWLEMEFVEGLGLREWLKVAGQPSPLEPEFEGDAAEGVDLDVLFDEPDSDALLLAARARRSARITSIEEALGDEEQEELNAPERVAAVCDALAQISEGLAYIHGHGLVHRDLKPSNVLVTPQRRAVLVDFGLLKRKGEEPDTDPGRVVGTYRYMSPEQARGEPVDPRSDLYSLGAVLYELIAGRPAFPQDGHLALLEAVASAAPPPAPFRHNPSVNRTLGELAARLLEKDPKRRPHEAQDVALMLRGVARGALRN